MSKIVDVLKRVTLGAFSAFGLAAESAAEASDENNKQEKKPFSMGGQAVIEGVMMNGPTHYIVSVRKENGEIVSKSFRHNKAFEGKKWATYPIIRGVVNFVYSLKMGFETLDYSAEVYAGTEGEKEEKKSFKDAAVDVLTYVLAIALAVGLFAFLPSLISKFVLKLIGSESYFLRTLIEGILRILIFLGYCMLISLVKDIRRTFEYHGAEHKSVNCYEKGETLDVEHTAECTRLNKRCGTSFIFIVLLVSIIVFMFVRIQNTLVRTAVKLLFIPLIAGVSYEVLKFSAKSKSKCVAALVAPGLLIQKITTREPDKEEIEVALNSAIKILQIEDYPLPEGTPAEGFEKQPVIEEAANDLQAAL